jgi:hypothetical protein
LLLTVVSVGVGIGCHTLLMAAAVAVAVGRSPWGPNVIGSEAAKRKIARVPGV